MWQLGLLLIAHSCASYLLPHESILSPRPQWDGAEFNWTIVNSSRSLTWTSCYDSFSCSRLQVPLDWSNSSNSNTVELALIKVPAIVPVDDPSFGGTILLNPGGPSGSGVDVVRWLGYGFRDIVDSHKHFEILSWDPRGVQYTTPSIACFGDDWKRQIWVFKDWAQGLLDSSEHAFNIKWAAAASFGKLCEESPTGTYPDGSNARSFVSTALTARDMVAIIDAIEVERSLHDKRGLLYQNVLGLSHQPALLNYWGFSYGTFLGNTFASMYPDRIGRMILDGNVDPYDYVATGWLSNLYDNNKTLEWFYSDCFDAGSKCAFWDESITTPGELDSKMQDLLTFLRYNPVPAVYEETSDIVSYADMANLIHGSAYAPNYHWPDLAQIAADLLRGNATSVLKYLPHLQLPDVPPAGNREAGKPPSNETKPYPPGYARNIETARAILCGDGESITALTKDDWKERIEILENQSPIAAPFWASIPFLCQYWPDTLRPSNSNRFTGPFESKLADYDTRASPLLFLGNTADPVTPLRNAISNAAHHEGARVLIQDTPGHCTGYVNPSQCTFKAIKAFFGSGTLPPNGTICKGDRKPWD